MTRNTPAIEGGNPVRKDFLPFHKPSIDEHEIREISSVLESGWLTLGPKTKEFESLLCSYLGARFVVAMSSCSEALLIGLEALGVGDGAEVITSPLTFASTIHAIVHSGASPVLADIEEDTFGMDPESAVELINERTKALLPVHFGGQLCCMEALLDLAEENDLAVLADAAHSFGAERGGKKAAVLGDAAAFSFYATKNITTGEGGCLATQSEETATKARMLSQHGIGRYAWERYRDRGSWYYDVELVGHKSNFNDLMAAVGIAQIAKADLLLERRRAIASRYIEALAGSPFIEIPRQAEGNEHTWHLFVIRLKLERLKITRDRFIEALAAENIGCSVHFIPIYRHPFFRGYLRDGDAFPICDRFFERCISLPIYPSMSDGDVEDVIEAIDRITCYYKK